MHGRRGFALLEASTALFILVFGLYGVFQMFQYSVDKIRVVSEFTIADRAIENELDTLRAQPFASLQDTAEKTFMTAPPELTGLHSARAHVEVRPAAALPDRLKEVTLVVRWRTENGRPVERRLTTLVARKGPA